MSGDDREPIGRKGKKALPKAASKRPLRRRRDEDEFEEEDYLDDEEHDDDDYDDEEEPMPRKVASRPPRKKRRWLGLFIKLFLVGAVVLAIYGVYLDSQIRSRIDGKVWQLPAAVYGRMVNLEPGMSYSKKEMVDLLEGMQYRQVTRMTRQVNLRFRAIVLISCAAHLISRMRKRARSVRVWCLKTIVWPKSKIWIISVISASCALILS